MVETSLKYKPPEWAKVDHVRAFHKLIYCYPKVFGKPFDGACCLTCSNWDYQKTDNLMADCKARKMPTFDMCGLNCPEFQGR